MSICYFLISSSQALHSFCFYSKVVHLIFSILHLLIQCDILRPNYLSISIPLYLSLSLSRSICIPLFLTLTLSHTHTHTHMHTHIHTPTHSHAHTHTCMHTYMHTHMHTHTHLTTDAAVALELALLKGRPDKRNLGCPIVWGSTDVPRYSIFQHIRQCVKSKGENAIRKNSSSRSNILGKKSYSVKYLNFVFAGVYVHSNRLLSFTHRTSY